MLSVEFYTTYKVISVENLLFKLVAEGLGDRDLASPILKVRFKQSKQPLALTDNSSKPARKALNPDQLLDKAIELEERIAQEKSIALIDDFEQKEPSCAR